jgi:hypothetical protein
MVEAFGSRQTKSAEDEVEATDGGANKSVRRRHVRLAGAEKAAPLVRTKDGQISYLRPLVQLFPKARQDHAWPATLHYPFSRRIGSRAGHPEEGV